LNVNNSIFELWAQWRTLAITDRDSVHSNIEQKVEKWSSKSDLPHGRLQTVCPIMFFVPPETP